MTVLPPQERAKGFIRPLHYAYRHTACNQVSQLEPEVAETFARDPYFYGATTCAHCGGLFPCSEFVWPDLGQVGT